MQNTENQQAVPEQEQAYRTAWALVHEIETVITGKHPEIAMLVTAMFADGHVLIEDVPGVGKTTLSAALASAAGLKFKRVQFTPDVMASDITGFNIYNRQKDVFEFREGLVMTNILLADEINRASPKTQSSLLESMEEAKVTVDGTTYEIPDPFFVIATQNPTGFVGTYPLPEAQLDRFTVRISLGYPLPEEEIEMLKKRKNGNPIDRVSVVADAASIRQIKARVADVFVDSALYTYLVRLIGATRNHPSLALGASPRASLSLVKMAQSYAFMHHRTYIVPEDIRAVFFCTIAHRLILRQEARLRRITAEEILREILQNTEVPLIGSRTEKPSAATM